MTIHPLSKEEQTQAIVKMTKRVTYTIKSDIADIKLLSFCLPHPQHLEVLGPGAEPAPQPQPEPQQ